MSNSLVASPHQVIRKAIISLLQQRDETNVVTGGILTLPG